MKLSTEARTTTATGVTATADFSINANGKAFKILIDKLYSNKELAVVRELSSNAYDAHIMGSCLDRPFEIHVPTQWEPWFSVKDHGPGMSRDFMLGGYTRVFHSTKDDSNTQVGAFGLGRLSPFTKVDAYSLTSCCDGVKSVYSIYLNDQRIPTIALMAEEPTTETGVEVQLAIKPSDAAMFHDSVATMCVGFATLPVITGTSMRVAAPEVLYSGSNWRMVRVTHDNEIDLDGAVALQGCVPYKIDVNAVANLTSNQRSLLRSNLIIDFPIGSLDITPSRESLSYDDATQARIIAAVAVIEQEIHAVFQDQLLGCKTMWQAYATLNNICRNLDQTISSILRDNMRFRNRPVSRTFSMRVALENANISKPGVDVCLLTNSELSRGRGYGRRNKITFEPFHGTLYLDDLIVVFEDRDDNIKLGGLRIRQWADDNAGTFKGTVLWIKGKRGSRAVKRLLVALGRPDKVFNLADMEKPRREKNGVNARVKTTVKKYVNGSLKSVTVDTNTPHIYVEMERKDVVEGAKKHSLNFVTRLYAQALLVDPSLPDLVFVPKSCASVVRKAIGWTSLWVVLGQVVQQHDDALSVRQRAAYHVKHSRGGVHDFLEAWFKSKTVTAPALAPSSALYPAYVRLLDAMTLARNLRQEAIDVIRQDHFELTATSVDATVKTYEQACTFAACSYPLVDCVGRNEHKINDTLIEHLLQYVNLIDENLAKADSEATEDNSLDIAA